VLIYKKIDRKNAIIIETYTFANYVPKFVQRPVVKVPLHAEEIIVNHHVDSNATVQHQIIHSAFVKYYIKMVIQWNRASPVYGLQDRLCFSRREALYNIVTEFGITVNMVRQIKLCLNATYSRIWVGRHLFEMFPFKDGLK